MPAQAEPPGTSAVELDAVSKSFGPTLAVDDVSFVASKGEFYSLLGPSGCGKTTTLRLIAGFERPDRGRISIVGKDVSSVPAHKRQVNTVFQQYALFPHLSVEDNVAYGLRQRRLPKDQIRGRLEEALATVRLTELRDRMPRQLSGGQQQRVALARALINEPAALLLDEPLAALDLKLRKALQGELKSLQERVGITFIYVTHDQEEALTLSERIAVMNGGRIVQEGTPEDIYERPRTRFVADFIGQTNFFEGEVADVGAETIVRAASGQTIRCAPASWARRGEWVAVSVRPEKIVPANGASSEPNRFSGTLVRRTYLGDTVLYRIELADRTQLVCRRQNEGDDASAHWEVGGDVTVAWPSEAALVLTADETAIVEDIQLLDDRSPGVAGGKE